MNEQVSDEKPLVTFALFAYNQEKYIREAVEGALAQTYSPLQIILSDDCSPDRTFEIMKEMVAEYTGPHEILLNRNKPNLGLAGHINYVMKLIKGEFIVVAAGDDISLPERTEKLFEFFLKNNFPAVVFSDCEEINVDGNLWQGVSRRQVEQSAFEFIDNPISTGATHAWCKSILTEFEDLNKTVTNEDLVMPMRAYILGRPPKMLNKKLIKYRRDSVRSKGSKILSVKLLNQILPYYTTSLQYLIDANFFENTDKDLKMAIVLAAKKEQLRIDIIKSSINIKFFKKSLLLIKSFGFKNFVKVLVIKYNNLNII